MKPKHQRLLFVAFTVVCLIVATILAMRAFRENMVFFYGPSEWLSSPHKHEEIARVGGLVKTGSVVHEGESVSFVITDQVADVRVHYRGILPTLFREGQGVIAQGKQGENGIFEAKEILAKHDENYLPREVVDSLKKAGRWKEPAP